MLSALQEAGRCFTQSFQDLGKTSVGIQCKRTIPTLQMVAGIPGNMQDLQQATDNGHGVLEGHLPSLITE